DLRQEVHGVLAAAVNLGMTLLTAKTFDFRYGHPFDSQLGEGFLHFLQLEGFNNRFDFFHEKGAPERAPARENILSRLTPLAKGNFTPPPRFGLHDTRMTGDCESDWGGCA